MTTLVSALAKKYLGSFVRHGLTLVAGVLLAFGVSQETADSFVTVNTEVVIGLIVYAAAQAMSFISTDKSEKGVEPKSAVGKVLLK